SLRGTIAVVVILVKGHTFSTNVKVHPVDEMALVSTTLFFLFKLGCDPIALESKFTHVEESTGVLKTTFMEDVVLAGVFPDKGICSVNLIFLSLFFEVTAISLVPKSVMQGHFILVFDLKNKLKGAGVVTIVWMKGERKMNGEKSCDDVEVKGESVTSHDGRATHLEFIYNHGGYASWQTDSVASHNMRATHPEFMFANTVEKDDTLCRVLSFDSVIREEEVDFRQTDSVASHNMRATHPEFVFATTVEKDDTLSITPHMYKRAVKGYPCLVTLSFIVSYRSEIQVVFELTDCLNTKMIHEEHGGRVCCLPCTGLVLQ
nr:hypothetical protein [Tanacetum cinerariifolium]